VKGEGGGDIRYARDLRARLQDVFVHRTRIEHEGHGLSGGDQDCSSGVAIPVVVVAEKLEGRVVVGIVRKVKENVVGLDETRHRLQRTSRRGGKTGERKMEEEMVVGGRREGEGGEHGRTPSIILLPPI